jgi:hypothetical protein
MTTDASETEAITASEEEKEAVKMTMKNNAVSRFAFFELVGAAKSVATVVEAVVAAL